jgi:hypothetical protein
MSAIGESRARRLRGLGARLLSRWRLWRARRAVRRDLAPRLLIALRRLQLGQAELERSLGRLADEGGRVLPAAARTDELLRERERLAGRVRALEIERLDLEARHQSELLSLADRSGARLLEIERTAGERAASLTELLAMREAEVEVLRARLDEPASEPCASADGREAAGGDRAPRV